MRSELLNRGAAGAQGRREMGRMPACGSAATFWFGMGALIAWILIANEACGQVYQIRVDKVACVNFQCRRYSEMGSAVCIGRFHRGKELFLTSRDLIVAGQVRGLWLRTGTQWLPAQIVKRSGCHDLAVLGVNTEPLVSAQISPQAPQVGAAIAVAGIPANGNPGLRIQQGQVLRVIRNAFEADRQIDTGERGGGVFDGQGRLLGVMTMTGGGRTICEPAWAIRDFLMGSFQQMPQADPPKQTQTEPAPNSEPGRKHPMKTLLEKMESLEGENARLRSRVIAMERELRRGNNASPEQAADLLAEVEKLTARLERFEGNHWSDRETIAVAINAANARLDQVAKDGAQNKRQLNAIGIRLTDVNELIENTAANDSHRYAAISDRQMAAERDRTIIASRIDQIENQAARDELEWDRFEEPFQKYNSELANLQSRIEALEFFKNHHRLRVELLDEHGKVAEFDEVLFTEPIQFQFSPIANQPSQTAGTKPTHPTASGGGSGIQPGGQDDSSRRGNLY